VKLQGAGLIEAY